MDYPKYKLLVVPPVVNSSKSFIETIEFNHELINENRLDKESDDEIIQYILNEIISEYEQAFHKVTVFNESEWDNIPNLS